MGLETGNYIGDLNTSNPASSDAKAQGDDHIRLLKTALKQSFAGFAGAIVACGTDGGSANTYTVTPATAITAYGTNMAVIFSPVATNTGASTVNISSLGTKNIKSVSGAALTSGDLAAASVYVAIYNGTEFRLVGPTKNYIDQLSFSATLPAQSGNAGRPLTTDGTNAAWNSSLSGLLVATGGVLAAAISGTDIKTINGASIVGSGDVAVTGGWVLLSSATASNSASVSLETTFDSTYDVYVVTGAGITTQNDGAGINMQMKISGAYDTGSNYQYHRHGSNSSSTVYDGQQSSAATSISVIGNVGNAAGKSADFTQFITVPASTSLMKKSHSIGVSINNGGNTVLATSSGHNTGTGALTGVKYFASSGNLVSGSFYLYGVKKS